MLRGHDAKATFMVIGSFVREYDHEHIRGLLEDGCELGNHCMHDDKYIMHSFESFERDLLATDKVIAGFQTPGDLFRAPCGLISSTMRNVLAKHGKKNIMADVYPFDPVVSNPEFIASYSLSRVQNGSIIVLHMPESGFRTWSLHGLDKLLRGLKQRGFGVVTVSELLAAEVG